MTVELPRPTRDSDPAPRLVVYDESEKTTCQFCGDFIVSCGYDCQFDEWVHISGSRAGSHKCGIKYQSLNASP